MTLRLAILPCLTLALAVAPSCTPTVVLADATGGSSTTTQPSMGSGSEHGGSPTSGPVGSTGTNPFNTTSSGTGTMASSSGIGFEVQCPANYCMVGGSPGGYGFVYADGLPPKTPTGTSTATLQPDELCMDGHVMQLPPQPTAADYANDWGLGIGVYLNQPMGMMGQKMPYALTGTGITVRTNGVPSCTSARVVIDHGGQDYCAALTDGIEIPWGTFNTTCWAPSIGIALTGAPTDATALKVQFVTHLNEACDFTKFCLTGISL
jgi:hypothetical protein